jgi:hypothetical protein
VEWRAATGFGGTLEGTSIKHHAALPAVHAEGIIDMSSLINLHNLTIEDRFETVHRHPCYQPSSKQCLQHLKLASHAVHKSCSWREPRVALQTTLSSSPPLGNPSHITRPRTSPQPQSTPPPVSTNRHRHCSGPLAPDCFFRACELYKQRQRW